MSGRVLGKYRILEQIGEGGMGVVYRAEHVLLGSPAAIKVLLPQYTRDPDVVDRFFTEAKAASAIRHVGITDVFDFGRLPDGEAYLAMELLRGEDLTSFLARHGTLDPSVAAEIAMQMLAALDAAHAVGVVHRDLKPDNVYLTRDQAAPGGIRVKILDFGIAKLIGTQVPARAKTKGGSILGTPSYMAPEQCRGAADIDARADLYAVGCILFELLVGRPPFSADGDGEVMAMHIYQATPRVAELAPHVPPELAALVAKLLAKAPQDRVPSAAYALAALERVPVPRLSQVELALALAETSAVAAAPVEVAATDRLPRWIPIVVLLVALAIAFAVGFLIGTTGDDFTPKR